MFTAGPLIFIISLLFLYLFCSPHHSINFINTKYIKKDLTLVSRNNLGITTTCTVLSELYLKYKLFFSHQCLEYSILVAFIELCGTRRHYLGKSKLESRTFKPKAQIWKHTLFIPLFSSLLSSGFFFFFSLPACLEPPFSYQSLIPFHKSPGS